MLPIPLLKRLRKQRAMTRFYRAFVKPGVQCFDIGANKGERTAIFRSLGARVVALEPQESCYNILQKKFGRDKNITLLKAAAGAHNGTGQLMLCDESDECATLSPAFVDTYAHIQQFHWSSSEAVRIVTLEELCRQHGVPALCKIDVEGYEPEVLAGLQQALPLICFEFNRPLLHDTVKSLDVLSKLGQYACNFIRYEQMELALQTWMPLQAFRDTLEQQIGPEVLTGEIVVRLK